MVAFPERNDAPIACPRELIVLAALFVPPSDGNTVTIYWLPEPVETTRPGITVPPESPVPAAEHALVPNTRIAALMIACFTFVLQSDFDQA
jgi:hypothetical protein